MPTVSPGIDEKIFVPPSPTPPRRGVPCSSASIQREALRYRSIEPSARRWTRFRSFFRLSAPVRHARQSASAALALTMPYETSLIPSRTVIRQGASEQCDGLHRQAIPARVSESARIGRATLPAARAGGAVTLAGSCSLLPRAPLSRKSSEWRKGRLRTPLRHKLAWSRQAGQRDRPCQDITAAAASVVSVAAMMIAVTHGVVDLAPYIEISTPRFRDGDPAEVPRTDGPTALGRPTQP